MKTGSKARRISIAISTILIVGVLAVCIALYTLPRMGNKTVSMGISVQPVNAGIMAQGNITSLDNVNLHFQTAGQLAYLPFQVGDKVSKGEVIARLDTYDLQKELSVALNNYINQRNAFDQGNQSNNNGILYQNEGTALVSGNSQAINDAVKRILEDNQVNLNNSVLSVEIANYALQLATLTSPINGVITGEDVTSPGVNVTNTTTFSVSDPSKKIFTADVPQNDIAFITKGSSVVIHLDGIVNQAFIGKVLRIHPQTIVLSNGETVYEVDIQSSAFANYGVLGQSGSVVIQNKYNQTVILVPSWLVLNNQYVWINQGGKPVLQPVTTGGIVGSNIEILSGLTSSDQLISNPKTIVSKHYWFF